MSNSAKLEPIALRIPDAARSIGVSRSKLYAMAKEGQIRVIRIGGVAVVPRSDLEALIP